MERKQSVALRALVECGMLVALAAILCIFPKFKFLAYGGSITVCSMLPIVLASYRHGLWWGLLSGLAFSLIQMLTGFSAIGINLFSVLMVVVFDYLAAFTVLGLGGMFRKKFRSPGVELSLGALVAMSLRFFCHTISGYFVWGEYAEWFFSEAGDWGARVLERVSGGTLALLYSVVYNALYMIPEIIITCTVALLIGRFALVGLPKDNSPSLEA